MKDYHLELTYKTKFLNLFRRLFRIEAIERILLKKVLNKDAAFLRKFIPPDYLYPRGTYRSIKRNGIAYHLDISNVVDHYLYWGYRDNSYSSIIDTIKSARTILDIGANIGTTSLFFASINPTARIYSFEPHPQTFQRTKENVRLNNFSNIQLLNLGLGEKKDTLKLYEVNEHNPGMNRIIAEERDLPYASINVDRLDTIAPELNIGKLDFIKIDVEGFEYAVLAGARETITGSNPVLFIELNDDNLRENNRSASELIQLLVSYGYTNIYRADTNLRLSPQNDFKNCHYDIIAR